jgi:hypothetical protein
MSDDRSVSDAATLHKLWIPDNPDGSGWAEIDWVSAVQGSRYHYQHGQPLAEAEAARPAFYLVRTRSESEQIPTPHENTYYIPAANLADFLGELLWNGGAEVIWHIEPVDEAPPEAHVT